MTGTRRAVLTAALFSAALVFLVVAMFTHSAIPLFVMWVPLLAVPLVLGRADPGTPQSGPDEGSAADVEDQDAGTEPSGGG